MNLINLRYLYHVTQLRRTLHSSEGRELLYCLLMIQVKRRKMSRASMIRRLREWRRKTRRCQNSRPAPRINRLNQLRTRKQVTCYISNRLGKPFSSGAVVFVSFMKQTGQGAWVWVVRNNCYECSRVATKCGPRCAPSHVFQRGTYGWWQGEWIFISDI